MSELKPCPFCGAPMIPIGSGLEAHWMHPRNHKACLLSMRPIWDEDVERWNLRADIPWLPEELVERLRVTMAHYEHGPTEWSEMAASDIRDILAALEPRK